MIMCGTQTSVPKNWGTFEHSWDSFKYYRALHFTPFSVHQHTFIVPSLFAATYGIGAESIGNLHTKILRIVA